jgi:NAD-dependent DNA ligase
MKTIEQMRKMFTAPVGSEPVSEPQSSVVGQRATTTGTTEIVAPEAPGFGPQSMQLVGLRFAITGKLVNNRQYYRDVITSHGGVYHRAIRHNTTHLIVGVVKNNHETAKMSRASEHRVTRITERGFMDMIRGA